MMKTFAIALIIGIFPVALAAEEQVNKQEQNAPGYDSAAGPAEKSVVKTPKAEVEKHGAKEAPKEDKDKPKALPESRRTDAIVNPCYGSNQPSWCN